MPYSKFDKLTVDKLENIKSMYLKIIRDVHDGVKTPADALKFILNPPG